MTKRKICYLSLMLFLLPTLGACSEPDNTITEVTTILTNRCGSTASESRLVCFESSSGQSGITPFDSGILMRIYGKNDQLEEIKDDYVETMAYYSAVFDRHYNYRYRSSLEEEFKPLYNLKSFNDSISQLQSSNDKSLETTLPDLLYDGLKKSVGFSLNSDMKFNLTVGGVTDVFSESLEEIREINTGPDVPKDIVDFSEEYYVLAGRAPSIYEWNSAIKSVASKEQLQSLFTFDDANKKITINNVIDIDEGFPTSITLSGLGKGQAQEVFQKRYPKLSLLFDGGTSSIKVANAKTSGNPWRIRVANPLYQEELSLMSTVIPGFPVVVSKINSHDIFFEMKGSFTLSTSGYYNNYFYSLDEEGNVDLYHHIFNSTSGRSATFFDSASIFISDAGLADMYSTALMNCSSLEEAENLRKKLDGIYEEETWAIYLAHEKLPKPTKTGVIAYVPNEHKKAFDFVTGDSATYDYVTTFSYF